MEDKKQIQDRIDELMENASYAQLRKILLVAIAVCGEES